MSKINALIEQWIPAHIRKLSAYHVQDVGNAIKLDAMENPYTWDENLRTAWLQRLHEVTLARYPDADASAVKAGLRQVMQIPENMDILLGNGSDEIIQMLALCFNAAERVLLVPEPSFVMYRLIGQAVGMRYLGVPLREGFALDVPAMLQAIAEHNPALIFLASPNNPTGNAFALADILQIVEASRGVVVIDEAYIPFGAESFMPHLEKYPNVLLMRTVSKLGLAGLRLGLLVAAPAWIAEIEKTRLPYNINSLTQVSASFALENFSVLQTQITQICKDRELLSQALRALPNVQVWDSMANFILFRVSDAPKAFAGLKAANILIKNMHGAHPMLENCLRVTIGTPEENRLFLTALEASL
jgi:histidinol-phosphate aminotransferase